MKKRIALLLSLNGLVALSAVGADIVNGWSATTTIASNYSEGWRTNFRLTEQMNTGCGHDYYWSFPFGDTQTEKYRLASLFAAHLAGRRVQLRCEGGRVTDVIVLN